MFCNQCGHKNPEGAKFCSKCGSKLQKIEGTDQSPVTQEIQSTAKSETSPETVVTTPEPEQPKLDPDFVAEYISARDFGKHIGWPEETIVQRIRDGEYQGRINAGMWYVHRSELDSDFQAPQTEKEIHTSQEQVARDYSSPFDKFIKGGYGLAMTYWLFGIAVNFLVNIVLIASNESGSDKLPGLILISLIIYQIFWGVAVFRAATLYTGPAFWAGLARVLVVLTWIVNALALFGALSGM